MTNTFEGSDRVAARGMFTTRVIGLTLVDVVVTVPALEAGRTLGTAGCHVALGVIITTVAVTKTIFAPCAASTTCN